MGDPLAIDGFFELEKNFAGKDDIPPEVFSNNNQNTNTTPPPTNNQGKTFQELLRDEFEADSIEEYNDLLPVLEVSTNYQENRTELFNDLAKWQQLDPYLTNQITIQDQALPELVKLS